MDNNKFFKHYERSDIIFYTFVVILMLTMFGVLIWAIWIREPTPLEENREKFSIDYERI